MKKSNVFNLKQAQISPLTNTSGGIGGTGIELSKTVPGTTGGPTENLIKICKILKELSNKTFDNNGMPEIAKQLRELNVVGVKNPELEELANMIENPGLLNDSNTIIKNKIEEFLNKNNPLNKTAFNLKKISKRKGRTSYEKKEEEEEEAARRGRKSNPFKFLMGQVQKLFDRGWSEAEIVKHISKHHDFEKGIISRAYDMVRKREIKKAKEAKKSFNLKYIYAEKEEKTLYDIENNLYKRSTRELLDRLYYLTECENYYQNKDNGTRNNYKLGNLSSVPTMLKNVKEALKKRGMSEKDIEYYRNNIKEKKYYPFENVSTITPTDAEKGIK